MEKIYLYRAVSKRRRQSQKLKSVTLQLSSVLRQELFTRQNRHTWLTRGWSCGWCPAWRGRARGRPVGWAGCHSGPAASPCHPRPAAAATRGESGCPRTGSEHPEDPSPPALQTDAGCPSAPTAGKGGKREKYRVHFIYDAKNQKSAPVRPQPEVPSKAKEKR